MKSAYDDSSALSSDRWSVHRVRPTRSFWPVRFD